MDKPLQVTFHNLDHSEALEADVRARVAKLEETCGGLASCRVVVDCPHRNPAALGKEYAVRIEARAHGRDFVVNRDPVPDLREALNAAFDVAKRQLRDQKRGR